MPANLDQLIANLGLELELTAEDIADVFWLTHWQQQRLGEIKEEAGAVEGAEEPFEAERATVEVVNPPPTPGTAPQRVQTGSQQQTQPPQNTSPSVGVGTRKRSTVSAKAPAETSEREMAVPNAPAIRDRLSLIKALRPLIRSVPSGHQVALDEAATANKIAEEGIWRPVTQPVPETWLELALVVDESSSMLIWRRMVAELQQILRHYGAFRDVRLWGLVGEPHPSGEAKSNSQPGAPFSICLRPGIGTAAKRHGIRSPQELIDPTGRRLILIVTDCLSSIWRDGTLLPVLEAWTQSGPVAILQVFPQRLWGRTALREIPAVTLSGLAPGTANKNLSSSYQIPDKTAIKLPIFNLETELAAAWSQMVSGKGSTAAAGFLFPSDQFEKRRRQADSQNPDRDEDLPSQIPNPKSKIDSQQRIEQFYNASSPLARRLAGLLAASPVISLPAIRLVQETLLPQSEQFHVAEVLLGGLFEQKSLLTLDSHADDVEYRFVDEPEEAFATGEIRSILLDSAPRTDTVSVLSKYIERRLDYSLDQFIAAWRAWSQDEAGAEAEKFRPFAVLGAEVLRRKGGKYAEFVREVEEHYGLVPAGTPAPPAPSLSLFAEDTGETLRAKIAASYGPKQALSVDRARDLAFAIDRRLGKVTCIYTGSTVNLSSSSNPRHDALSQGISGDTIFPQSKATEAVRADLHNILQARLQVNSARRNLPFAEIPASEVSTWFRSSEALTSIPREQLGEYSKLGQQGFEARDAAKGQIARVMFYIRTIYGEQTDTDYFQQQQETLRQWHQTYPPTPAEIERSRQVAKSEQGNPNPFTIDPTLVERIYFPPPPEPEWQEFEFDVAMAASLQTTTFEVAAITIETDLQPFEFEVATIEVATIEVAPRRGKQKPQLSIQRQQLSAWQFTEDLGNGMVLEMVSIPEGNFWMGSPATEKGHYPSESPQHEVHIDSFFLGKYAITQAQWRAVAALPRVNRDLKPNPSRFKGDDRPVEGITWYGAVEFCDRLSQHTGRKYRLPSEAEWEYACRSVTSYQLSVTSRGNPPVVAPSQNPSPPTPPLEGGKSKIQNPSYPPFHFGKTITTDLANYNDNYTYGANTYLRKTTTPVGSFGVANAFGLYDMHGNVWEWCSDVWHDNYEGAPDDGSVWQSQNENENRYCVLRGGSFGTIPVFCRSAYRLRSDPVNNLDGVGLRVACAAARTP